MEKITEEQYQSIIESFTFSNYKNITEKGWKLESKFKSYINEDLSIDEIEKISNRLAMAVANPLTCEWAHEQFVEKEKIYKWKYKKQDSDGDEYRLSNNFGVIALNCTIFGSPFTEKEVIDAGYNPDMFERIEVDNDK
ncbi:hypothetical protein H7198_06060 [Fructobacillus sp. CRL 2054]|uniref:hypothetical protein n=1 Tax=Fructobacillus sp. CRL 2054 TaxID=2763007 RepID=UPI0023797AAE|nr:hypothetical protein [Fructobacillus sp. CRL 2054]MDD9139165.1 hypothetical protein [Fructobacillus sp. CRL 2054]